MNYLQCSMSVCDEHNSKLLLLESLDSGVSPRKFDTICNLGGSSGGSSVVPFKSGGADALDTGDRSLSFSFPTPNKLL